jgi:23S rRNA (adenine2030-N6)-methyltransferase
MNYRHAYHAGNFADVVKHAVLGRMLAHLGQKPAAFRVIDTHAGSGVYDLAGPEAGKTGEWRDGIGRLLGHNANDLPAETRALLAPYLDAVTALNPPGELVRYPGSPALVQAMLRRQDRLIACELEPQAALRWPINFAATRGAKRWRSTAGPHCPLTCRPRNAAVWC